MIQTILLIIVIYFLISFFIPLFILPNYLIFKPKHKITNQKLKEEAKILSKIKDKAAVLKSAVDFVTKRYCPSGPIIFLFHLPRLFWNNPNKIIEREGFAYCHVQNLMLKTILIESGKFNEAEIKTKINFTLVIHQYLQIKIKDRWIDVDPWAIGKGIPFGKHLNTWSFLKMSFRK